MVESNDRAVRKSGDSRAPFAAGIAIAGITALLAVWVTIVHDDGNGAGQFMVILAAAAGWFAAGLRAQGMARAMAGVAAMQVAFGLLIATAPSTPAPDRALVASVGLAALWLGSGLCFRRAAAR